MAIFISGLSNDDEVSDVTYLARMRYWRNEELKRTDWTQLPDAVCEKTAWLIYRQSLRDMPASNTDPRKITLPILPI